LNSEDPRDSQDEYWNQNLDPQNLGRGAAGGLERERPFYLTPDQQYALEQLAPAPGKTILEVGCGLGLNAMELAHRGAAVIAIDIAGERLKAVQTIAAEAGERRVHLVKAAAEALPFRASAFDAACSKSVLIHTHLERAVPELARVLKREGVGVFIEPLATNPLVNLYRRTLAPKEWQSIVTYFTESEIDHFRRSFATVQVRPFYWLGFLAFGWQFALPSAVLLKLSQAIFRPFDYLLMRVPYFRKSAWFIVITARK